MADDAVGELDAYPRDVYRRWRKAVSGARRFVVVFTPYFDQLLPSLFGNVPQGRTRIAVVTDLAPESGILQYRKQLLATRTLIERGYEVRSLRRLHAKVLLVDSKDVVLGSQNFTSYGRGSREVSLATSRTTASAAVIGELMKWFEEAEPVDADLVEELLAASADAVKELCTVAESLQTVFDETTKRHTEHLRSQHEEAQRVQRLMQQLMEAAAGTDTRSESTETLARLNWIWREGGYDGYQSFVAEEGDFLSWVEDDGTPLRLRAFRYHPMVVAETGRMAFVRVARKRISYFKTGVTFTEPVDVDGRELRLEINFPKTATARRNVELIFRDSIDGTTAWRFDLLYDGGGLAVVDDGPVRGSAPALSIQTRVLEHFSDPDVAAEWLGVQLKALRYETVGIDNPNIAVLLPKGWQEVQMIPLGPARVLVAAPHGV